MTIPASIVDALLGDLGADPVDVEVDVDLVGDGLLVAVLHHEVLVEEPERLLVRRRGQPDRERVEVVEHLPPQPEDRAVALVDDHHVERLGRNRRVVLDRHRLAWSSSYGECSSSSGSSSASPRRIE